MTLVRPDHFRSPDQIFLDTGVTVICVPPGYVFPRTHIPRDMCSPEGIYVPPRCSDMRSPGICVPPPARASTHSKNIFVTLTYSLSFEMRHDSSCPVTFYTQNSYTHQWLQSHNYYRCGILPCYYSGNQVMWTSTDCF